MDYTVTFSAVNLMYGFVTYNAAVGIVGDFQLMFVYNCTGKGSDQIVGKMIDLKNKYYKH